ncbi:S-layer homology domain-containing protein [Paenibacillus sp. MBLB4367]|uniref:S-layer homology domain-containing protein n=1 Tax=Paenibacillus sp. MBLB4367 TaxID=3384767 RepID=UPI003907EE82
MRKRTYKLNVLLIVCLLFSLMPSLAAAAAADTGTGGATVSQDVYAVSQDGNTKLKMNYVNFNVNSPKQVGNYLAVYTSGTTVHNDSATVALQPGSIFVKNTNAAIQVDAQGKVLKVAGPTGGINNTTHKPNGWEADQYVSIPPGGYVILASDDDWVGKFLRRGLYETFKVGDTISLQKGGQTVAASDLLNPSLELKTMSGTSVTSATYNIEGKVHQYTADAGLSVKVGDADAAIQADGSFRQTVTLTAGLNTIVVKLFKGTVQLQEQTVTLAYQPASSDLIEIEAPPADITIVTQGPKKKIDYIDKDITGISNIFALFTPEYGSSISVGAVNVAIQVDASGKVTKMVNQAGSSGVPSWTPTATNLEIPQGGYVVIAQDSNYANNDIKKFLATKFKPGDTAKLRKNGDVVDVSAVMTGLGTIPRLQLDNLAMYTTADAKTTISGLVTNPTNALVTVGGQPVALQPDGKFSFEAPLAAGANYLDIVLKRGDVQHDKKTLVVYSNRKLTSEKQVILWVDQASNARKFQSSQSVLDFLQKAKDAGVTDVAFDVKGVEGFVSYKNSDLTNRPYVSEMTAPERRGSNPNLDLLEEFLKHSHALGLKVHAAFNVFAEGSIAVKDFALIDQHLDWEEQVFRAEDNGQIMRLRESDYGKKGLAGSANGAQVLFVNPANDQVRDFQLKTFEEVLKNYDVDGIILDRGRYDNETADFSAVTKAKFEAFLQKRGKQLNAWPDDVFRYVSGKRTDGPLIQDWWEFRSGVIESFVKETHDLVNRYEDNKSRTIQTSAYVGSWFESYYLNGVHWGSKDFRYDPRLGFPTTSVYTDEYYKTGYINYLDFLMVGTYYGTAQEIQRYLTIDTIVTNGEVPLYAGMDLTKLQSPSLQKDIFQNAMSSSNGLMLFDASLANWPIIKASVNNENYVKDYQIGISKPGDAEAFLEASYYNVSRNTGDMNVYNEEFGTSTGTNKFGVEVVTDATGKVTKVVNKTQASTWNWTVPEDNNSAIPAGGMIVSALDDSGVRTKRQLLANTYSVGDDIRAAALSGYLKYEGKTVTSATVDLTGNVKVMGIGSSVAVKLNGMAAVVAANGDFTGKVSLQQGANTVTMAVYVDGKKTNAKSFQMTYQPSSTPDPTPSTPSPSPSVPTPSPTPTPTSNGVKVSGTVTETKDENGKAATKVTVDAEKLRQAVETLSKQTAGANEIFVEVPSTRSVALLSVSAQALADAEQAVPGALLTVKAGAASYQLPADLIDAEALAKALGAKAGDVQVTISLEKKSGADADAIAAAVKAAGGEVVGDVYEFRVTVQAGSSKLELADFGKRYVTRSLTLPKTASNQATAVVIDPETGEMSFVPARFVQENGTTTVIMKRTGNSMYAVVRLNKTFADTKGHWAQADVELLASKLLVKGVADNAFAPDQAVTRAEFAALLVRALGLTEKQGGSAFADVHAADWYAGAVAAASAAGLIQGYEDGSFRPNAVISREELAVLAARAFDFAGAKASPVTADALKPFADAQSIGSWAQSAVSRAVSEGIMNGMTDASFAPQEQTSRAQAAVLLKRLAMKIGFMN